MRGAAIAVSDSLCQPTRGNLADKHHGHQCRDWGEKVGDDHHRHLQMQAASHALVVKVDTAHHGHPFRAGCDWWQPWRLRRPSTPLDLGTFHGGAFVAG